MKTRVIEPTVPGIVNDSLRTMTTQENQARIKTLLDLPDVQKSSRALAEALVAGALDELTLDQRRKQLDGLATEFVLAVTEAIAEGTEQQLGPAFAKETARVLRANLEVLLAEDVRQGSQAYVAAVTHAFASTLTASMADGIVNHTGPAVTEALERQLLPGVAKSVDQQLGPVLATTSREVAKQAALGFNDALDGQLGDTVERRFFKRIDGWFQRGENVADELVGHLKIAVVFLLLLLSGSAIALYLVVRALRKRTLALELVTYAVKGHAAQSHDRAVVDLVKAQGKKGPGKTALDQFLATRPQLKA